jgi:succinyl-CoA synthetase beta subunit
MNLNVPLVVRLTGTNEKQAKEILAKNILIGIKKYLSSNPNIAKNF